MALLLLNLYFNSIKVQLKPNMQFLLEHKNLNFNSIKVQLKPSEFYASLLRPYISIP